MVYIPGEVVPPTFGQSIWFTWTETTPTLKGLIVPKFFDSEMGQDYTLLEEPRDQKVKTSDKYKTSGNQCEQIWQIKHLVNYVCFPDVYVSLVPSPYRRSLEGYIIVSYILLCHS